MTVKRGGWVVGWVVEEKTLKIFLSLIFDFLRMTLNIFGCHGNVTYTKERRMA